MLQNQMKQVRLTIYIGPVLYYNIFVNFCDVTIVLTTPECCRKIEITSSGPAQDPRSGQLKRLGYYTILDDTYNGRVAYRRMYFSNGDIKENFLIFSKVRKTWEVRLEISLWV